MLPCILVNKDYHMPTLYDSANIAPLIFFLSMFPVMCSVFYYLYIHSYFVQ